MASLDRSADLHHERAAEALLGPQCRCHQNSDCILMQWMVAHKGRIAKLEAFSKVDAHTI
jgi:hypothetical protein